MQTDYVHFYTKSFTGVRRIEPERIVKPFVAQDVGGHVIGRAWTHAGAETIARGYRIDKRREGKSAQTRVTEQRRPVGVAYIAV